MPAPAAKSKPAPATIVAAAPDHSVAPLAALRDLAAASGLSPIQTVRDFANDRNRRSQKFYRIINEVPTILMIVIVVLVVVKPF